MQYDLRIPKENEQAHLDIEKDIEKRQNGLFTFVLRLHGGKITDYNLMETVDAKTKYLSLVKTTWQKLVVSRYPAKRD